MCGIDCFFFLRFFFFIIYTTREIGGDNGYRGEICIWSDLYFLLVFLHVFLILSVHYRCLNCISSVRRDDFV